MAERPDNSVLIETATAIVRDLIRGERDLHAHGPRRAAPAGSGVAGPLDLLMATRMHARLRYVFEHSEERGFLFGLLGRRSEGEKLADIRLNLTVAPALARSGRTGTAALALALPGFVQTRANRMAFDIRLATGGTMTVWQTIAGGRLTLDDGIERFAGTDNLPWRHRHSLIATLAEWTRTRQDQPALAVQAGDGARVLAGGDDRLDMLFRTVGEGFMRLIAATDDPFSGGRAGPPARPPALNSLLGDHYRLDDVRARLLVNLDARGAITTDPDADRQQFDIEAVRTSEYPLVIALHLRIPDLLVATDRYHRRFLDALRTDDALAELFRAVAPAGAFASRAELSRFLALPSVISGAVVMRTSRIDDGDGALNLLYLEGETQAGLTRLFIELRFRVSPWPAVEVAGISDPELLAASTGGTGWQRHGRSGTLSACLDRVLILLATWWRRAAGA